MAADPATARGDGGDRVAERRAAGRVTPDAITRLGLTLGGPVLALIKSTSIEVIVD